MKLSKPQFEQLLRENRLVLSLIGMSNIGKTYWSKKFSGIGFGHFNCDDLIEAQLGLKDVSHWLGQPYDEMFSVNQQKYLALEKDIMENILTRIKNAKIQNSNTNKAVNPEATKSAGFQSILKLLEN